MQINISGTEDSAVNMTEKTGVRQGRHRKRDRQTLINKNYITDNKPCYAVIFLVSDLTEKGLGYHLRLEIGGLIRDCLSERAFKLRGSLVKIEGMGIPSEGTANAKALR